jgi:transposase-like protein
MNGIMGSGIQVMVDEKDVDKASELLGQNNTTELKCPVCNSVNLGYGLGKKKIGKILFVFLSLLSFIPFNNSKPTWYCKDCKREFTV